MTYLNKLIQRYKHFFANAQESGILQHGMTWLENTLEVNGIDVPVFLRLCCQFFSTHHLVEGDSQTETVTQYKERMSRTSDLKRNTFLIKLVC